MEILDQLPVTGGVGEEMHSPFLGWASVVPPKDLLQGHVSHEQVTLKLILVGDLPGPRHVWQVEGGLFQQGIGLCRSSTSRAPTGRSSAANVSALSSR